MAKRSEALRRPSVADGVLDRCYGGLGDLLDGGVGDAVLLERLAQLRDDALVLDPLTTMRHLLLDEAVAQAVHLAVEVGVVLGISIDRGPQELVLQVLRGHDLDSLAELGLEGLFVVLPVLQEVGQGRGDAKEKLLGGLGLVVVIGLLADLKGETHDASSGLILSSIAKNVVYNNIQYIKIQYLHMTKLTNYWRLLRVA